MARSVAVFERLPPSDFTPAVRIVSGRKVVVCRNGIVLGLGVNPWQMIYAMPKALLTSTAIGLASVLRRGWANPSGNARFGFIHSPWTAGYYHWLTESLPRSLVLRELHPEAIPLLPSQKYAPYVESLKAIGFDRVDFFPDSKNAICSDCAFTDSPTRFATTDPRLLKRMKEVIFQNIRLSADEPASEIVYVSRRKARGRRVLNEPELLASIADLGVREVAFEDLSFVEQVRLMAKTRLLIGIHGAGLTNLMFMPTGGSVIELLPKRHSLFDFNASRFSFRHDACYLRLATDMGISHHHLEGRALNSAWKKTHMANITIDPQDFRQTVETALHKSNL